MAALQTQTANRNETIVPTMFREGELLRLSIKVDKRSEIQIAKAAYISKSTLNRLKRCDIIPGNYKARLREAGLAYMEHGETILPITKKNIQNRSDITEALTKGINSEPNHLNTLYLTMLLNATIPELQALLQPEADPAKRQIICEILRSKEHTEHLEQTILMQKDIIDMLRKVCKYETG